LVLRGRRKHGRSFQRKRRKVMEYAWSLSNKSCIVRVFCWSGHCNMKQNLPLLISAECLAKLSLRPWKHHQRIALQFKYFTHNYQPTHHISSNSLRPFKAWHADRIDSQYATACNHLQSYLHLFLCSSDSQATYLLSILLHSRCKLGSSSIRT